MKNRTEKEPAVLNPKLVKLLETMEPEQIEDAIASLEITIFAGLNLPPLDPETIRWN